jgi:hypothetical protein
MLPDNSIVGQHTNRGKRYLPREEEFIRDEDKELLDFKRYYEGLGLTTRLGHAYTTKTGAKRFDSSLNLPEYKINAIQAIPIDIAVIIDVDVRYDVDGHDNLPCAIPKNTPTVQTQSGIGRQYWFQADPRLHTHADHIARIDVLTGKSGIFMPPSEIEGGGSYSWLVPLTRENLRPLPDALFQYLLKLQEKKPTPEKTYRKFNVIPGSKTFADLSPKQRARLDEALSRCRTAPKGHRSEADFGFIIWGLSCGLDENSLLDMCRNFGKFKERGIGYFRGTVKQALGKLGR